MAEEVTERVSRYIHDGSDQDLRRLLRIAEGNAEAARAAFRGVGVQHGWNAIDCGCGPIGGLVVLAEMVGPAGRVAGVDVSPAAVQRARAVVAALELGNVEVIAGDLHDLGAAALGGPFDLAFTRNFLTHQAGPVRTLRALPISSALAAGLSRKNRCPARRRGRTRTWRLSPARGICGVSCCTGLEYRLEPSRTCPGRRARRALRSLRRTAPS